MPIRKEFRHFYTGPHWKETRERILARAKNKCEQCGKPNLRRIWIRLLSGRMWWSRFCTRWRDHSGKITMPPRYPDVERQIRVVLTIAHLNHTPGDDRDENLKALCAWCHFNYDKLHHKESRILRKEAERPLLAPAVEVEKLRETQRSARDEWLRTRNPQALQGMEDYFMEECIILMEGR